MRKCGFVACALLLLGVLMLSGGCTRTVEIMVQPRMHNSFERLCTTSDLVVRGTVTGPIASGNLYDWLPGENREKNLPQGAVLPASVYDMTVAECWKGGVRPGEHVYFYTDQGKTNGAYYVDSNLKGVDFTSGQEFILFLASPGIPGFDRYMLNSTVQGVLILKKGVVTDSRSNQWVTVGTPAVDIGARVIIAVQE